MAMPYGGKTTHTTLESRDIASSLRFYHDVMGLRVNQPAHSFGHLMDSKGHYAAILYKANPPQQPLLNFYARPVAGPAEVDAAHARITAVRDDYGIAEITAPATEDAARFGVGSYGFYLNDLDGNWWRVEDNAAPFGGPFGPVELPRDPSPANSIVPAGPISYVVLESRSLPVTMRWYRDGLGLEVAQPAPHYCLVSDPDGWVRTITVEVGDRLVPQQIANHHGITFSGGTEVIDALHARLKASASELAVKKVFSAVHQHGSYSFYVQDADTNCWELEVWDNDFHHIAHGIESRAQ